MNNRYVTTLLAGCVVIGGCSEISSPADGGRSDPANYVVGLGPQQPARGIEMAFVQVARDFPEFAGFYVDDQGMFVVRATNKARQASLREFLRAFAAEALDLPNSVVPNIVVDDANYDIVQLMTWRDRLRALLSLSGVWELDADERANVVRIGVLHESARASVIDWAQRLGVPLPAVHVEITQQPPLIATLRDSIRPLPGGMQIQLSWLQVVSKGTCTLGVNGSHALHGDGFITASHCTIALETGADEGWMSQPYNWSADTIGYEVVDPPAWIGGSCPAGRRCRNSDAAFIKYRLATTGQFGTVAQPAFKCTSNCTSTSDLSRLNISSASPRWFIHITHAGTSTVGIGLQKVGRTTGWTSGTVDASCSDYNYPSDNLTLFCQTRATGMAAGGDSGSPVFRFVAGAGPNKVAVYGILFAGCMSCQGGNPSWVFSPWDGVIADLGSITVH
jgi:hypothetical protein